LDKFGKIQNEYRSGWVNFMVFATSIKWLDNLFCKNNLNRLIAMVSK